MDSACAKIPAALLSAADAVSATCSPLAQFLAHDPRRDKPHGVRATDHALAHGNPNPVAIHRELRHDATSTASTAVMLRCGAA